ncbi:MAG: hypothetical protein WCT35_08895 [Sideroxydans sp.]|jgi:hypothetical protein
MIEYIFFDATLRDRFVTFAEQRGVPFIATDDPMGMVVEVSEDISDELSDEVEAFYDTLELEQEALSKADGDLNRLAGFRFNLPNGQSRMLPVEPEIANRLMAHFTLEEIQHLLDDVAHCTIFPNDEHLCKILAARKQAR